MFTGFFMLLGAMITAVMFGEMAVVMSSMYRGNTRFSQIQELVNTAMKNMGLPDDL